MFLKRTKWRELGRTFVSCTSLSVLLHTLGKKREHAVFWEGTGSTWCHERLKYAWAIHVSCVNEVQSLHLSEHQYPYLTARDSACTVFLSVMLRTKWNALWNRKAWCRCQSFRILSLFYRRMYEQIFFCCCSSSCQAQEIVHLELSLDFVMDTVMVF